MITIRGFIVLACIAAGALACAVSAQARDVGQCEASDPAIREWYRTLMQPDIPDASCCGAADAYYADEIHVKNGKV